MVEFVAVVQGALGLVFDFTFKLTGAGNVIDRLKDLPDKMQNAIGRRSARRAMAIVRDAARVNVRKFDDPETPDRIWKNVYMQQSRRGSKRIGGVMMKVGILGGAKEAKNTGNPGGDTWYWRFIELGKEGQAAQPFLRPALENNANAVADKLVTEINLELDKLAPGR